MSSSDQTFSPPENRVRSEPLAPPKAVGPGEFSLAGKVILLTGGAGIYGRDLAADLAAAGATLVIASRDVAALQKVAAAERARGFAVHARALDQSSESSILQLRDAMVAEFGRIDGLVNNAVARPMRSPADPLSHWEISMKTNATGLFAITRAFGAVMAQRGVGSIVNVGSIQGMVGPTYSLYEGLKMDALPDYFFHKGGMINLTRFFAAYYGPQGVRVNCVSPGGFQTEEMHPTFVGRYSQATFLRRLAEKGDLGGPVVFLLSAAARYVTGVNLPVDGGYTAH
ncbi:MAG: SDR family oxidoreductase [Lacunisphaera sp.]|nr:SDR family oxidoreductase [Lacunisphaera sp.]